MKEWTEVERLIVAYARSCDARSTNSNDPQWTAIINHGRKLIAEAEPKIMSADEANRIYWDALRERSVAMDGIKAVLSAARANIAAVLDKKIDACEGLSCEEKDVAKDIVAETLRVLS